MDLSPLLVVPLDGHRPAARWASSGGMWLTGRPEGPPLAVPSGVTSVLDGVAERLRAMTASAGIQVGVDGARLLGERAALSGLRPGGTVSCGGATRLLPAADGWVAVSLPRADDLELLPAWLAIDPPADVWAAVAAALRGRRRAEVVAAGGELGLAVAALGERSADRRAAQALPLGAAAAAHSLVGLRVIDLSALWAGPLCGQLLAAAGMEVVKVESTRRPDGARSGPPAFFDLLNAAKSSVAVDFTTVEGRRLLRRLVSAADVVIEGSRPRALQQLGIDVAEVAARGRLRVWVSITGHGRAGECAGRVGFGDDAAVAGGLVGREARGPVFCADAIADPAAGLVAAAAAVDRLLAGGRWLVDVALARTAALLAGGDVARWEGPVEPPSARPVHGRAAPLGRDTGRILAALGSPP